MRRRKEKIMSSAILPQDKPLQWKPARELPPDGDVTIKLEGLFSICYLKDDPNHPACQLGVFNQDAKHFLEITINGGTCTNGVTSYRYTHAQVKQLADEIFTISILNSDADVAFYQRDDTFNRATSNVDEDFRWLIDVESPDLYNQETGSKQRHYGPKILVKNGIFFTSRKTKDDDQFDFVERSLNPQVFQLGFVARETAARIVLNNGQVLRFEFKDPDGAAKICTFESGDSATILFQNLCWEQGQRCKTGDFHLHFTSFAAPNGKLKFDLRRRGQHLNQEPEKGFPGASSDRAPCHAMGYGMSGGGTP